MCAFTDYSADKKGPFFFFFLPPHPVQAKEQALMAHTCTQPHSAGCQRTLLAGDGHEESGTVTTKFRSGRKILDWTQHLLSSPEIADVDLSGLSNN